MTVCKHCGTEIEDGLEYCPNCGQSIDDTLVDFFEPVEELEEEAYNIFDTPEEFDMDSLLEKEFSKGMSEIRKEPENLDFFGLSEEEPEGFSFPEEFSEPEEISFPEEFSEPEEISFPEELSEPEEISFPEELPEPEEFPLPDAFPEPEEFSGVEELQGMDFFGMAEPEYVEEEDTVQNKTDEQDDIAELLGLFGEDPSDNSASTAVETADVFEFPVADEADLFALDDLFQDLDGEPEEFGVEEPTLADQGLEELLAAGTTEPEDSGEKKRKNKKEKKEKKSFFQAVFGNVPIDPSKIKPEPTPEQIAAKKQKEEEEKKAKAEEKNLAAEEKKQNAQRLKEDKARQKALKKEEKKTKKMIEAKLVLEEMKETRINRLGASIVFLFFAVCALALFFGGEMFGYAVSVHSAEKNFNKAYNNNVKYYNDAYNDIYGIQIKEEDQLLNEKIMTVMFVNKELNSYNSQMVLKDYEAALHSLLLGLYRYGKYYEQAIPLGIDKDMDFVRTQILGALKDKFGVSEDEAEVLRSMLEAAGAGGMNISIDSHAAREYNQKLYEIVQESERLKDDSNN